MAINDLLAAVLGGMAGGLAALALQSPVSNTGIVPAGVQGSDGSLQTAVASGSFPGLEAS